LAWRTKDAKNNKNSEIRILIGEWR
jgi:hypothetical protein